ncbi:MAG: Gfo/Idh/MocA family oxidoreductase [Phycicoccus sp.]|nr:Gfo/Idh/MocA family oxidoreductase [Phycicoccus sp.]NMM35460.1 Gfo/Idh/MocA family oxidoreductase [Phycicoccus sp.]
MYQVTADRPIRWGFLGAGGIALAMAADLHHGNNMLYAVAARDADRAAAFAAHFDASHSHGDYRSVVEDPDVDIVYIATTHPFHREQALMAIDAGKHVLIEKPLALNAAHAREVLAAARDKGVFAMEAVWMRANPLILKAQELVAQGVIGDTVAVHADFSIEVEFDPAHRLFDLANGGGALLDLGVYPMHFAWLFLGRPDTQQVLGTLSPTGSDATVALQWGYGSGATAQLRCATTAWTPGRATIAGTAGSISVEPWFLNPGRLVVTTSEGESRVDGEETAYGPQIEEVERCLRAGLLESPRVPHADTIAILELIDQARADLGVRYPGEAKQ